MRIVPSLFALGSLVAAGTCLLAGGACSSSGGGGSGGTSGTGGTGAASGDDGGGDASHDAPHDVTYDAVIVPPPDGSLMNPCELPGSIQFTASGTVVKAGGNPSWPDLSFLHLPVGFCAHYYGNVGNPRQLRFAPGGELFVASPTTGTTGGGGGGLSAIMVLPDDNLDGVSDGNTTFLGSLPSTQGLMFTPGYLYYQDHTMIMRVPYTTGQRTPAGPSSMVANITYYSDSLHWPKPIDIADDGSIFIGNGGSQSDQCVQTTNPNPPPAVTHPFLGGIRQLDPTGAKLDGLPIAQGFRNPIAVRCSKGHNQCFALELSLDYSYNEGGREKLVPIRPNQSPIDDWGFPCCATQNLAYPPPQAPVGANCSGVSQDTNSFLIGDTPFGLDIEQGFWPGQYNRNIYVALHGAAGNWWGARVVSIPTDPTTGLPMPTSDLAPDGGNKDGPDVGMTDFATGWDDGTMTHGRPAAVTFAPDGRLFVANDYNGVIFWVAAM
jgi:glucose/arabinose dehydrogenase